MKENLFLMIWEEYLNTLNVSKSRFTTFGTRVPQIPWAWIKLSKIYHEGIPKIQSELLRSKIKEEKKSERKSKKKSY